MKCVLSALFIFTCFFSLSALATNDEHLEFRFDNDRSYTTTLDPAVVYGRTQSVLKYYQSPVLYKGQANLNEFHDLQSFGNLKNILKYFDVHKTFSKLFKVSETSLLGFDDFLGLQHQNFKVRLHSGTNVNRVTQSYQGSLNGLRIAIDPGHMGGDPWDKMTGKFVRGPNGEYLSEGVMALQTAILLKEQLTKLGATVELTRNDLQPVTEVDYNQLPVAEYAKRELLEHVNSSWFLKLLERGTGNHLFTAFNTSPERKKLWAPTSRYNYFILKEDLWARADRINAFDPDIVLVIHYDILPSVGDDGHGLNPKAPNQTKIYVSGAYYDVEFGSRLAREQFARKLLDQTQWDESLLLSKSILAEFKNKMGLEFPNSSQGSIPVEDGIFARNLTLPRFLKAPAIAYLECLFYNRPQEFYALLDTTHDLYINGINYPYSDRLLQVVDSIKQGVVEYAQSK